MTTETTNSGIRGGTYDQYDGQGYLACRSVAVVPYRDRTVRVGSSLYRQDELRVEAGGSLRHVGGAWYLVRR